MVSIKIRQRGELIFSCTLPNWPENTCLNGHFKSDFDWSASPAYGGNRLWVGRNIQDADIIATAYIIKGGK